MIDYQISLYNNKNSFYNNQIDKEIEKNYTTGFDNDLKVERPISLSFTSTTTTLMDKTMCNNNNKIQENIVFFLA